MAPDTWWKNWLVWLGIGLVLFVWAGLAMGRALAAHQAEQQRRDAHWQEVNAAAARTNPRVLPGEEKPGPAPLPGRGWIALLAIAATVAVGRAGWLWLDRLRSLWSPGGAAAADSEPAHTFREPTLGRPGQAAPVPPSRSTPVTNTPLTTPASRSMESPDRQAIPRPSPPVQRPPHRPGPPGTTPDEFPEGPR